MAFWDPVPSAQYKVIPNKDPHEYVSEKVLNQIRGVLNGDVMIYMDQSKQRSKRVDLGHQSFQILMTFGLVWTFGAEENP